MNRIRSNNRLKQDKSSRGNIYDNFWIIGIVVLIGSLFYTPLKIQFLGIPVLCDYVLIGKSLVMVIFLFVSLMIKLQANYLHLVDDKSTFPLFINSLLVSLIIFVYKKIDFELILIIIFLFFSIQNMIYLVEKKSNNKYVFNSMFFLTIASLFAPKLVLLVSLYMVFIIYFKAWNIKMISVLCISFLSVWLLSYPFLYFTNNSIFVDKYFSEIIKFNVVLSNFNTSVILFTIFSVILVLLSSILFNKNRNLYSLAGRDGFFLVITLYIFLFIIWFFSEEDNNYNLISSLIYPSTVLFSNVLYNLKKRSRTVVNRN